MRYRHYQLAASGNQQQAVTEAQELVNYAERQVWTVLNDIDGAIQYIVDGEKQHPNRHDALKERGRGPRQQSQSGGNNLSTATFGQFSAFGNQASVSAAPHATHASLNRPSTSFGPPTAPASSFGQPSTLGPPKPSFGQLTSAFGQHALSSNPGGGILGQAPRSGSAFTQSAKESPFGQVQGGGFPVAGGTVPGSLQPPLSAFAQPNNPFGQNSAPPPITNPFGQNSALPPPTNSFGQNPALPPPTNPFGQNSALAPPTNSFGQNSALPPPPPMNTFGRQPSFVKPSSTSSPFEKLTVQQPINTFGQPTTTETQNPFALAGNNLQSTPSSQLAGPANSFNQPKHPQASNTNTFPRPATTASSSTPVDAKRDSQGKLITWKGTAVQHVDNEICYKDPIDGTWKKIWFPDGPPAFTKAAELPDEAYDESTRESYRFLGEHGIFKDGLMPELPPRREWCNWNF